MVQFEEFSTFTKRANDRKSTLNQKITEMQSFNSFNVSQSYQTTHKLLDTSNWSLPCSLTQTLLTRLGPILLILFQTPIWQEIEPKI